MEDIGGCENYKPETLNEDKPETLNSAGRGECCCDAAGRGSPVEKVGGCESYTSGSEEKGEGG